MKKSKENAKHYPWGTNCNAWFLSESSDLTVIEEMMPAGTEEQLHFHENARQVFYILDGQANFTLDSKVYILGIGESIEVEAGIKHCIKNDAAFPLRFLVVSSPNAHGDRVEAPFEKNDSGLSLNYKSFKAVSNSDNGEVGEETVFRYREKEGIVWASYHGGDILFGMLSGFRRKDQLFFNYQHQNKLGEILTGKCETQMIINQGLIELHESWEWTCKDFSKGKSILIEIQ